MNQKETEKAIMTEFEPADLLTGLAEACNAEGGELACIRSVREDDLPGLLFIGTDGDLPVLFCAERLEGEEGDLIAAELSLRLPVGEVTEERDPGYDERLLQTVTPGGDQRILTMRAMLPGETISPDDVRTLMTCFYWLLSGERTDDPFTDRIRINALMSLLFAEQEGIASFTDTSGLTGMLSGGDAESAPKLILMDNGRTLTFSYLSPAIEGEPVFLYLKEEGREGVFLPEGEEPPSLEACLRFIDCYEEM